MMCLFTTGTLGCAHQAAKLEHKAVQVNQDYHQTLVKEARAEADHLRSELASVKIAIAKQNAEVQSLRQEASTLRQREKDALSKVQQFQSDLVTTREEREQLRRKNSELQGKVMANPTLQEILAEIQTIQTSVTNMVDTLKTLETDVTRIKHDMQKQQRGRQQTARMTSLSGSNTSSSKQGVVIVKPGDTLWEISQTHAVSIETLKQVNGLDSDLIIVGQRLTLPKTVPPLSPLSDKQKEVSMQLKASPGKNSPRAHPVSKASVSSIKESTRKNSSKAQAIPQTSALPIEAP